MVFLDKLGKGAVVNLLLIGVFVGDEPRTGLESPSRVLLLASLLTTVAKCHGFFDHFDHLQIRAKSHYHVGCRNLSQTTPAAITTISTNIMSSAIDDSELTAMSVRPMVVYVLLITWVLALMAR
mmetsp:Transcript_15630/g.43612  ORF Transcript_15630/g.43612 Transcript_15630/m.43612 type:complete len:124 (+) Transcript_15630:119-490(+)